MIFLTPEVSLSAAACGFVGLQVDLPETVYIYMSEAVSGFIRNNKLICKDFRVNLSEAVIVYFKIHMGLSDAACILFTICTWISQEH